MAGNEVEIVVTSKSTAEAGVDAARSSVKGLAREVDDAGGKLRKGHEEAARYGKGLEGAGEAADASETRIMGMKDTVDGVATVMQGPGQQGLAAYLQGWADLASGVANFVIPAMQSFTLANAKAVAGTVGSKVAMVATSAATKAWAAAQWLLNVALTANPIGLVIMAIAALVGAIILAYRNSETFRKIADAAFKAIGKAVSWLVEKAVAGFKILWAGVEKVWSWFKKLTGGSEEAADATDDVAESSRDAADAAREQADALDELTDRILGLRDGEAGLEDAIDKSTAALKENGKTTDVHTEKGRNNRRALDDIVRSTMSWRDAAREAGKSQAEQNRITERGRDALIRAGTAMGMTREEARRYADQVLRIPRNRSTTVTMRTPNLRTVQHNFDVVLRDRVVNVRVVTTGSTRIADNDKFTGGIIGAASGGPRGRLTMVGEHGPELVTLPTGSMVHSNPDTERMLGGGGGSDRPILIELKIGDRSLGAILVDPLRKEVRAQGGDVQAVLGSG